MNEMHLDIENTINYIEKYEYNNNNCNYVINDNNISFEEISFCLRCYVLSIKESIELNSLYCINLPEYQSFPIHQYV